MKTRHILALGATMAVTFTLAGCGSVDRTLSLAPVTSGASAQGVALYFGDQPHAPVQREIGTVRSGVHIARQLKDDGIASCNQAFGLALDELRSDARRRGANAVVGISTNFHSHVNMSSDTYVCGMSQSSAALRMQGRAVRLGRE